MRQANNELEIHQRIQSWSLWPDEDFPRTASTMKIRHAEVAQTRRGREAGSEVCRSPAAPEVWPATSPAQAIGPGLGVKSILAEMTGRDAAEPE